MIKILCIGDVVGRVGRETLMRYVDDIRYKENIDLVIANGENSAHGRGMSRSVYDEMTRAGVDGFTMGNHTWGSKEVIDIMNSEGNVIRPANYSKKSPGEGSMILRTRSGKKIAVINIIGRVYLDPADSPFDAVTEEIKKVKDNADAVIVDFHAEATSEKIAMGYFLDGKVSAVFGTHTHVQTADERILAHGTGYMTDLGMTGPYDSVLGMKKEIILRRFETGMQDRFDIATGKGQFSGCIFTIDEATKKCTEVKRLYIV